MVLRARKHGDVLVIDDGSTDRTAENARLAGATILSHDGNQGKGVGIRTALRFAAVNGFDFIVLMDGDGQHDPDEIPNLLEPLRRLNGPVDVVLGDRTGRAPTMPTYRRAGKAILDKATSIAAGGPAVDSQCGYRALTRRGAEILGRQLTGPGFEVESEMLMVIQREGLAYENVPVTIRYDGIDGSTQHPIPHAARVLDRLFVFLALRRPLLTLGLPGVVSVVFGAYWGIRMLQAYQNDRVFVESYGLAAATFVLLGLILVATSLMLNVIIILQPRLRAIRH